MKKRTLKEIALELLGMYEEAQGRIIDKYCVNIDYEQKLLSEEIEKYKQEIENAEA